MARKTHYDLRGRTVLITGAARGIGAGVARALAARGARVALVGHEPEELEQVAADCGRDAIWFEADVTIDEDLQRAVDGTVERFGGIDVVMANAGIGTAGFVRSADPAAFERTIQVNLIGVYRTVHACLPSVIERRGYVLNVASMAAIAQLPGMSAYAATKAGVEAFSNALRAEVHHLGVDVGVAYYHWIATDMVTGADASPVFGPMRAALKGPIGKTYPLTLAVDATVKGIERRADHIFVPGWVGAAYHARTLVGIVGRRDARAVAVTADALAERDVHERGLAASLPVGAGGAADARASGMAERAGSTT
jgi:NAD(P)-dependent dehydrogenase (short-subunit alcohol dehydrogenase family)